MVQQFSVTLDVNKFNLILEPTLCLREVLISEGSVFWISNSAK